MILVKIIRTRGDVLDFLVTAILAAFAPLAIMIASFFKKADLVTLLAWAFYLRHYVWTQIDYLFNITFLKTSDHLFVRFMGVKLPLSYDDSFLVIEEAGVMKKGGGPDYHIRLARNTGTRMQRFFKNRIRISQGRKKEKTLQEQLLELHRQTGLRYVDYSQAS